MCDRCFRKVWLGQVKDNEGKSIVDLRLWKLKFMKNDS